MLYSDMRVVCCVQLIFLGGLFFVVFFFLIWEMEEERETGRSGGRGNCNRDVVLGMNCMRKKYILKKSLNEFGLWIKIEFPTIYKMPLNVLLPFCTLYLCKVALSVLATIKSKYWCWVAHSLKHSVKMYKYTYASNKYILMQIYFAFVFNKW